MFLLSLSLRISLRREESVEVSRAAVISTAELRTAVAVGAAVNCRLLDVGAHPLFTVDPASALMLYFSNQKIHKTPMKLTVHFLGLL